MLYKVLYVTYKVQSTLRLVLYVTYKAQMEKWEVTG